MVDINNMTPAPLFIGGGAVNIAPFEGRAKFYFAPEDRKCREVALCTEITLDKLLEKAAKMRPSLSSSTDKGWNAQRLH